MSVAVLPKKEIRWTPRLIKRLRQERTFAELAELLGANAEDIELWENGQAEPTIEEMTRLSELADKEGFLRDWKLAGSGVLQADLEEILSKHRKEVSQLLDYRASKLQE